VSWSEGNEASHMAAERQDEPDVQKRHMHPLQEPRARMRMRTRAAGRPGRELGTTTTKLWSSTRARIGRRHQTWQSDMRSMRNSTHEDPWISSAYDVLYVYVLDACAHVQVCWSTDACRASIESNPCSIDRGSHTAVDVVRRNRRSC